MKHKGDNHWKQKKCTYYWGVGAGCRFPDYKCINIHRMEEQQGTGVRRQGVRAGGWGPSWGMEAGGQGQNRSQLSWAGVARGQGSDARKNIDCRDGSQCQYHSQGSCRYRHSQLTNRIIQTNSRELNQAHASNDGESSFNMQEMKLTIDNLVKAVYNLKSLSDFPKVSQNQTSQ